MWIIGLTGAIGSGKSTISGYFRNHGIPVHCADEEVHRLLDQDVEIKEQIKRLWPDVFQGAVIDRNLLGTKALSTPEGLSHLEAFLYPKLVMRQKTFLEKAQQEGMSIAVLDVPLLFEVGLDAYCDRVVLALAPEKIRRKRVLQRTGMSEARLDGFEASQLTDEERVPLADYIVGTGRAKEFALKKVNEIIHELLMRPAPTWDGKWPSTLKRKRHASRNRPRH